MLDFSLSMLEQLLLAFKSRDTVFTRFDTYWDEHDRIDQARNVVLLRHDVDRAPKAALATAKLEARLGIFGTYFFRTRSWTLKPAIIGEIASLGHEIGYHYETLADADGDFAKAAALCSKDLKSLRSIAPVVSATMHSRPLSRWDGRLLWKEYPLEGFDLKGEGYLTIDHYRYTYLADSGRNWNADRNVIWDSVEGSQPPLMKDGTEGLIEAIQAGKIDNAQLLVHPNRWPAGRVGWLGQYFQDKAINNAKDAVRWVRRRRNTSNQAAGIAS